MALDVGILMFVTERALPVTDLARACEERGIESLWVPEHPVVPARYETRYPLSDDGKLPRPYTELPDAFATLAAAAAVTRTLRVGGDCWSDTTPCSGNGGKVTCKGRAQP